MKTFTATHLNKHAQEVFAAVDKDGSVEIKHDRYPDRIITIEAYSRKLVGSTDPYSAKLPLNPD